MNGGLAGRAGWRGGRTPVLTAGEHWRLGPHTTMRGPVWSTHPPVGAGQGAPGDLWPGVHHRPAHPGTFLWPGVPLTHMAAMGVSSPRGSTTQRCFCVRPHSVDTQDTPAGPGPPDGPVEAMERPKCKGGGPHQGGEAAVRMGPRCVAPETPEVSGAGHESGVLPERGR